MRGNHKQICQQKVKTRSSDSLQHECTVRYICNVLYDNMSHIGHMHGPPSWSMVCYDRAHKIAAEGLHSAVWIITPTLNDHFYLIQLQR